MTEKTIDLKQFLLLICDQKDSNVNLNLDEGCTFEADDPRPLIKVLNYLINYMEQLTDRPVEISLDLQPTSFRLTFLAYTSATTISDVSPNLADTLSDYRATYKSEHNQGNYLQLTVLFQK